MADLLYLFQKSSPTELYRWIEEEDKTEPRPDWEIPPAPSCIYNKYDRGDVLPGPARIDLWKTLCSVADRVPELSLWDALRLTPVTNEVAVEVWSRLIPEVKRLVGPSGLPRSAKLRQLLRIGHIDALTAILLLIRLELDHQQPDDPHPPMTAYSLVPYAEELFHRLSVFPPFEHYRIRRLLYRLLSAISFTVRFRGDAMRDPLPVTFATEVNSEAIVIMKSLGRVGLIGRSLNEQVRFVNWWRTHEVYEVKRSIYRNCSGTEPKMLYPSDPLWKALKALRHPGTRKDVPIELPWKGQFVFDFRIANLLGEADVLLPKHRRSGTDGDHRRHADKNRRPGRSRNASKVVISDQRMQMRKPGRMINETDEL